MNPFSFNKKQLTWVFILLISLFPLTGNNYAQNTVSSVQAHIEKQIQVLINLNK